VVDDEYFIAQALCLQVEDMGLEVCGTATSADAAIDLATKHRPSIVLMDMRLQGAKDGVDAAMTIRDLIGAQVIFITGSSEPDTVARIRLAEPCAILFKPISDRQLRVAISAAMKKIA
jgi:CheY-like chemotaxis protein